MNLVQRAMLRLRAILRRGALEQDMQAEMREHLARSTERLVARGMSLQDARLAAKAEFGNTGVLQEEGRDARGGRWIDEFAGDVRFALRYFARHKATVGIIITVLAIGIGANTMIISTFQAEFFRPAPAVPSDDAHARIWAQERATTTARWQSRDFSQPELQALAERREIFSEVAGWMEHDVILDGGDSTGARGVGAQFVTPNYFRALGIPLAAGQGFAQSGVNDADMAAVMSFGMAEQLYGTAAAAVGRRILVNEIPVHVVGVAPPRFQGAMRKMDEPVLWIPVSARADIARVSPRWLIDGAALSLFARLAPNATREQATALARQVVTNALPDSAARVGMSRTADVLAMYAHPPGADTNELILAFTFITVIGILILLVGWMSVSSLMVAAAISRRHEIAVRLSLGASRARLLRQLVTESTLLSLVGSGIGLTLAWWWLSWMATTEIDGVNIAPDVGTFLFVLAMAVGTGILFGLSPALHATRANVSIALRDSGTGAGGRSRLQRGFVIAQIALSQPLLVILGTMLSMVIANYQPSSPEASRRIITVGLRPLARTGAASQRGEAVDSLVPRIAGRSEVLAAVQEPTAFAVRGVFAADRERTDTATKVIHLEGTAPGWFALMDVPIILGRDVSLADTAASDMPVVIGSDLARALWGDATPVGRKLASPVLQGLEQDSIAMTVVGVYDATRISQKMTWNGGAAQGTPPVRVHTAHGKHWRRDAILVRTHGPAEPFLSELRRFVRVAAPSLPVSSMMTLAQVDAHAHNEALRMSLAAGAGGVVALLLASLGLYGVVSLAVQQRTREIGIRIAVGALPSRVARMFLVSGVRVSGIALLLGLPLSVIGLHVATLQGYVLAPIVNVYLIGGGIAMVLLAVASAATWVPARRAARVDPASTLRVE